MRRLDGRNTVEGPKFFNQQCSAGHRREIWKDEDSVEVEDSGTGHVYKSESQTNSYEKVINQNADNGVAIEITYKDDHRTSKRPLEQPRLQEVKQQYTSRTALLSSSSVMHIEQLPQSERFSTKAYNGPVKGISSSSSKEAHMFKDSMGCSIWSPAEYPDSPTSAVSYVSRCVVPVIGSRY